MEDIKKIYDFLSLKHKEFSSIYDVIDDKGSEAQNALCDELLGVCALENNSSNLVAVLQRVVGLRDDLLIQVLKNANKTDEQICQIRHELFEITARVHLSQHEELLEFIKSNNLLDEFYRQLLRGVHEIGIAMTKWQPTWTKHIIEDINEELKSKLGSSQKVAQFLRENELFDSQTSDRSYSALVKKDNGYEVQPYVTAFADEVHNVTNKIDNLLVELSGLEDTLYNQKNEWLRYFEAIKTALTQTNKNELIKIWQEVDEAWMAVTSPLQVGHPLEYYEDHYRKAVALEWDVRISTGQNSDKVHQDVTNMYAHIYNKLTNDKAIYELSNRALNKIQLYIGRPALYYGAEFNGLFSAQVVPNDEEVTKRHGKKVFAFADNVLESLKAKPFLKISRVVFGKEFMDFSRELVFKRAQIWHEVYKITTIGHEYGHILWMDEDTEHKMNKSGAFKNIEEFKATMGGLAAYFLSGDKTLNKEIFNDTVKRAVGLMGWMKTAEVEPYYCEGLIHLHVLFESGVLRFDDTLHVEFENYDKMVTLYLKIYEELGAHYLAKKDASEFLSRFATLESSYMPQDIQVRRFVDYYWDLHCKIGSEVDDVDKKSDWI